MMQTATQKVSPTDISTKDDARIKRIRELNDQFRTGMQQQIHSLGRRFVTPGIWALGPVACFDVMSHVRAFKDFDRNNDPWHEHDFGSFDYKGHKIFWKIDYYDKVEGAASPDPSNPAATSRVLTVMLASEY